MMKINSKDFGVRAREKVKLKEWPTIVKPFCEPKKRHQKLLGEHVEELSALQRLHCASNRYAWLLIFQGMDAAGKDGAIRHVMSGVNPQGCQVFSFKQPSAEELEHDFLWRTTRRLPKRGLKHCAIFLHVGARASKLTIQPNIETSAHDEQNLTDDCFCRCDAA
jgi:polyphosphate kinase 2 (PPK2 family)